MNDTCSRDSKSSPLIIGFGGREEGAELVLGDGEEGQGLVVGGGL